MWCLGRLFGISTHTNPTRSCRWAAPMYVLDLWCIMVCASGKCVRVCRRRTPNRALRPRRLHHMESCSIPPASVLRLVRQATYDHRLGMSDQPRRRGEEHRIRPVPHPHPCKQGPVASRSKMRHGRPRRPREVREGRLRQRPGPKLPQMRAGPKHLRRQEARPRRRRNHLPAQWRQTMRLPPQVARLPRPMPLHRARRQPERGRRRPRRFDRRLHRLPPAERRGLACPALPLQRLVLRRVLWMLVSSRVCSNVQNTTSICKICFSSRVPTSCPSRRFPNSMPSLRP